MMKRMRRIESPKVARLLFLLCWFAYFTSYIGRLNYSSAMTEMIQGTILTKSQAGFISMVYFFAYGIGQLCNGILGDKFHPGKMIFTGLAIAAGANLCMGFAGGFQVMAVIWGINGYAQAMIWPPIIRIFAEMVSREQKMKFCVDIVSSQVLGTLASYLLAAGVMKLQYAMEMATLQVRFWWIELAGAVLMVVLGVIALFSPFAAAETLMIFLGASCAVSGVWDLVSVATLSAQVRRAKGKAAQLMEDANLQADATDAEFYHED